MSLIASLTVSDGMVHIVTDKCCLFIIHLTYKLNSVASSQLPVNDSSSMAPAVNRRYLLQKILVLALARRRNELNKQRAAEDTRKLKRRWWVRPAWRKRTEQGQFYNLYPTLRMNDREIFFRYIRMSPERFDHLLSLVQSELSPKVSQFRKGLSAEEKLLVALRSLATGDSQQIQSFSFHLGCSTVSRVIKSTCQAIWDKLSETYIKFPTTLEEWAPISAEYEEEWNFPHVIGALDGKHVRIDCPKYGGSMYYNYKNFHSTVMMAMCDAHYRFVFVDIGHYGKDNDASIFSQSDIREMLENGNIPIPAAKMLGGKSTPYFIIGDEIFPLKPWLMKSYPSRGLTVAQQTFNYRLSRARRTIENAFGVLSARWRIFHRAIRADITTVDLIVKATCCLHNYLLSTDNAKYIPAGFVGSDDSNGIKQGDWRTIVNDDQNPALGRPSCLDIRNYASEAKDQRNRLCNYVNSEQGAFSWQAEHVASFGQLLT